MKFGNYLNENKEIGWEDMYVNYDYLKKVIKSLENVHSDTTKQGYGTSLSVPRPTNAAGVPDELTQESFYKLIEDEMRKIEQFTEKMVLSLFDSCRCN